MLRMVTDRRDSVWMKGPPVSWSMMTAPYPGMQVRYRAAADPAGWRIGTLVRPSANAEEWLVKGAFGSFWLAGDRLFLAEPLDP